MLGSIDPLQTPLAPPDPVPLRPPQSRAIPAAHLPRPLSSFVGREREIATVLQRLRQHEVRLVTLTGPGGVGKTRLAIQVAEAVTPEFPDGVWFVPLAPVRDPALVASAIARALEVRETVDRSIEQGVAAFLAERRALLVLDNFEHVLDAGPLVTEVLTACPTLTVLVTSRTVLRLSGEHDIAVPPLSLPTQGGDRSPIDSSEAVRLFVERAAAADASFALTDANAADIATLCARLDGLPLAIELAAARVRAMPLAALLRRLDQRLRLLTGGARDQPVRLRSLRDAISWSHDLLSREEQTLFRRLAVFAGGFTVEAAEAVCAGADAPTPSVFDGIASLTDKSLLRQEAGLDNEPRYLMLETVREFGLEQLQSAGETDDTRRRQGAYYLTKATPAPATSGIALSARAWLDLLETEDDNLWSVLSWSLAAGEVETGLRLAGTMVYYWYVRKRRLGEARVWLDQALAFGRSSGASYGAMAEALTCASSLAHLQDDTGRARTMAEEAMAIFQHSGTPDEFAKAHYVLAIADYMHGDSERAKQLCQQALDFFRA